MPLFVRKLAETRPDLAFLIEAGVKVLGCDLASSLNSRKLSVDKPVNYLVLLDALKGESNSPSDVINDPGHLMNHVWFQYMVCCDRLTLLLLATETSIKIHWTDVSESEKLAIFSGSLQDFYTAITNSTTPTASFELRSVLNKIQLQLEADGYKFLQHKKVFNKDQTFHLTKQ